MRQGYVWLTLAVLTGSVAAQDEEKDRLRQAVRLPSVGVEFGVYITTRDGCLEIQSPGDKRASQQRARAEIAALRKAVALNPSDAESLFRLGNLLEEPGEKKESKKLLAQAARIHRQRLATHPADVQALRGLALCLETNDPEKEALLRKAIKAAPNDGQLWLDLALHLENRAILEPLGQNVSDVDIQSLIPLLILRKVSQAQMDTALKLLEESSQCCQKAASVGKPEGALLSKCGAFLCMQDMIRAGLRALDGEQIDWKSASFSEERLSYFRRAAELKPADYRILSTAVVFQFICSTLSPERGDGPGKKSPWETLPPESRQWIRARMEQMERLTQVLDRTTAAGCAEMLATLEHLMQREPARVLAWARRAVELDPQRDYAWEYLLGFLAYKGHVREAHEVARNYLRIRDNARSRFLLAKICTLLDQFTEAEKHLREGLRQSPDDVECNLSLACLLLRRGAVAEAGSVLDRLEKLMKKSQDTEKHQLHYSAIRGIYLGLRGEREEASLVLSGVLEKDSSHEIARAGLEAMGLPPVPLPPGPGTPSRSQP